MIIPTLDDERDLPTCLEALMEGLPVGLIRELIVTDGGSSDATRQMADEAGARVLVGTPSRGGQLRRAGQVARGRWLLVLDATTAPDPGWSEAVAAHVANSQSPACFRLGFQGRGAAAALVAGWANLRTRLFGLPLGQQGLLVRRSDYDAAGGFPDQPRLEDVALVQALKRHGAGRPVLLAVAARAAVPPRLRKGGLRNLWIQARCMFGADPERLAAAARR
ncbi:glycosyltransferase [Pukyongiella litopenaei]|uniref:glycosyltransferase n=1 Tax=Pukyongiella litopenaei TaxID=2605946 RepID=UPI0026B9C8F6